MNDIIISKVRARQIIFLFERIDFKTDFLKEEKKIIMNDLKNKL